MSGKRFVLCSLLMATALLAAVAGITAWIDPLFHYRGPRDGISYVLLDAGIQNDGIIKHYDYDAVITGTSMCDNFRTSEFDALFDTMSIKVSLDGNRFYSFYRQAESIFQRHPDLKYYLESLDDYSIEEGSDTAPDEWEFGYLYDDNFINDVQYLLNKQVFMGNTMRALLWTLLGRETTSRNDYLVWSDKFSYGAEEVLRKYTRPALSEQAAERKDPKKVQETMETYFVSLASAYPNTEFYLFLPPYSIVYWDQQNRQGTLQRVLDNRKTAVETLLAYENIHVFAFDDDTEMICDLDNYKDLEHYGEWINSQMLTWMKEGEHELLPENYQAYFDKMQQFYSTYDYDSLFCQEK